MVASFPLDDSDEIMMMTDSGRLIRCPVHDIRIAGRNTQGVTLFKVEKNEHVVSVARLADAGDDDNDNDEDGDGAADGDGESEPGEIKDGAVPENGGDSGEDSGADT